MCEKKAIALLFHDYNEKFLDLRLVGKVSIDPGNLLFYFLHQSCQSKFICKHLQDIDESFCLWILLFIAIQCSMPHFFAFCNSHNLELTLFHLFRLTDTLRSNQCFKLFIKILFLQCKFTNLVMNDSIETQTACIS